jgi:hypothetical protein
MSLITIKDAGSKNLQHTGRNILSKKNTDKTNCTIVTTTYILLHHQTSRTQESSVYRSEFSKTKTVNLDNEASNLSQTDSSSIPNFRSMQYLHITELQELPCRNTGWLKRSLAYHS